MPSLYIVLEEEIPGIEAISLEGRALSRQSSELQTLAENAGTLPLTSFFGPDEADIRSVLGIDFEQSGIAVPSQKWFPAADGLRTVSALMTAVAAQSLPDKERALVDLKEFQNVLQAADTRKIRWRLAMDY